MTPSDQPFAILVLGGTPEGRTLATTLGRDPRFAVIYALAGITQAPDLAGVTMRRGGFGGAEGLARFLHDQAIDAVVDATHPFAQTMARNAVTACAQTPLLRLERPGWEAQAGDRWTLVADAHAAVGALGARPLRVFLSTGRQGSRPFMAAPVHRYVLRCIEPPDPCDLPPDCTIVMARGPFNLASEIALMRAHEIQTIVTKNAGGDGTRAKLDAARIVGLGVIMIARPALPDITTCRTVPQALEWVHAVHDASMRRGV